MKPPKLFPTHDTKPWDLRVIDTKEVWQFGNNWSLSSLDLVCGVLDVDSPKNGDVKGDNVTTNYWSGKHEEIKELYEFGFANRGKNPYAPTGSKTHSDCNTYEQYGDVVHQKLNNIARHDALMKQQQEDSKRMKALKKEYKQKRAKEQTRGGRRWLGRGER